MDWELIQAFLIGVDMTLKEFLVNFVVPGAPALAALVPFFAKLNELENRGLELIRKIDHELTPLYLHEKTQVNTKIQIALLKSRVNDLEGFLQKQGFVPSDIDENSFL